MVKNDPISQCTKNPIYVFLFWELRGLSPNFHTNISVSDLYIPRIGPYISLQYNKQTRREIITVRGQSYVSRLPKY